MPAAAPTPHQTIATLRLCGLDIPRPKPHSGRPLSTLRRKIEFHRRFLPIPKQSFFLFGRRGTGKSTWLRHLFPEALFVDLLQPDVYREMSARPERLREPVLGAPQQETVVVDEVQRVPELLNVVHVAR